jgi:hypothetical protein
MLFKVCTGGEIRTPISGFGDRHSTLELHPLVFILLNAEEKSSINYFSNNIGFENEVFTLKNRFKISNLYLLENRSYPGLTPGLLL